MKQLSQGIFLLFCVIMLSGCSIDKVDLKKLRKVEITVVDSHDIPEELATQIEATKEEPFRLTYGESGYLYIARGYGTKDTSGYSIEVLECFETSNAICFKSNLLGPSKEEEVLRRQTCPYIVVKMEYSDKNIILD